MEKKRTYLLSIVAKQKHSLLKVKPEARMRFNVFPFHELFTECFHIYVSFSKTNIWVCYYCGYTIKTNMAS